MEKRGGKAKNDIAEFMKIVDEKSMVIKFVKFVCESREALALVE